MTNTKIKIDLEEAIKSPKPLIVELGCGKIKRQGRVGIDKVDLPGIDIVTDIEQGLPFLPDNSVDEIYCSSILEHIKNFETVVREIVRVLKQKGIAHVLVPHFSNPHYYSDFTHVRFFGLYTFYYFVSQKDQPLRRKVPDFYTDVKIQVLSQHLVFKSYLKIPGTRHKICRPIKFLCDWFFNLHPAIQEFYEQSLCYILPCKAIEVAFTPTS